MIEQVRTSYVVAPLAAFILSSLLYSLRRQAKREDDQIYKLLLRKSHYTAVQIAMSTGLSLDCVQDGLYDLVKEGKVVFHETRQYGVPVRYYSTITSVQRLSRA